MPCGPAALPPVILALLLSPGGRHRARVIAALLVVWLNIWWLLWLADVPLPASWPARLFSVGHSPLVMVVGHVAALLLLLLSVGVFAPRRGSQAEMAERAAARGDRTAAAEFWLQAGHPRKALRAFRRAGDFARAAEVARSLGRYRQAAHLLQETGESGLGDAAQLYTRLGEGERARELWLRQAQQGLEARQPELAIEPLLKAGEVRRAAHAVELALDGGRLAAAHADMALKAAREARKPALAARVAAAFGRFREAGDLLLASGQPEQAARAFERAGEPLRTAEALRLAGRTDEAARVRGRHLLAQGHVDIAIEEYLHHGLLAEAAEAQAKAGHWAEAAETYRRAGLPREAAELARDHGEPRTAARLWADLDDWGEAGAAWERAGELAEAAHCFERAGDWERALHLLARAGRTIEQAQLVARIGRVEEGFLVLFDQGDLRTAWNLLSSYGGTFPSLAEPLVKVAALLDSHGDTTAAISAVQRATAGMPVKRELLPALYTLAELLERHGDLHTAEEAWRKILDYDYSWGDAAQRMASTVARRSSEERAQGAPKARTGVVFGDATSRYVLGDLVGRGGMGAVYRAQDTRLGRTVAIKILNPGQHTAETLRRFEREARAAAALSHPGIVHIYDFDRGFDSYFISMELVDGPTMSQLLQREPAFVGRNLLPLARQITDAVAYAHSRHVVHRDLKPSNMVLAERRLVKILDFGIARRLDELETTASGATGTPYYMAPEQILGEVPDERTDVYSLGVTLFQFATGALPFATGNVLRAHLEQPPPDPRALAPELEPAVAVLILSCLAKDPAERPRDGGALLRALPGAVGSLQ